MDRERLDHWCERGILGVVVAIVLFAPLATGAVMPWEFLIIQGLTLVILLLWLARIWLGANPRLLWPPICWAVLAFAGYAVWRYGQADIEYVARQELIRILVYAFLFVAVLNHLHRKESIRILIMVLVCLGVLESLYAIYQFASDSTYIWGLEKPAVYRHRGSGTYVCPDHLAGMLELIWPVALGYALLGRYQPVGRVLFGYGGLVMLAGIGVTVSRGAWVATGAALLVFFGLLFRYRRYRLPVLIAVALVCSAGALFFRHAYTTQRRFHAFTAVGAQDVRLRIWRSAALLWRENVWLGVGPDHFDYRFPKYRTPDLQMRPVHVHNDWLEALTDWGIVGAALIAGAWVALGLGMVKTWKYIRHSANELVTKRSNKTAAVLGGGVGLLCLLLHAAVDFHFHLPANAILTVVLMAIVSSHLRFATDKYWVSRGWLVRVASTIVIVAGIAFLGFQGWRRCREDRHLRSAYRMAVPSFKIAPLEQAYAVEPMNPSTTYQLGEIYRRLSWLGNSDYKDLAQKSLTWLARTQKLNPWDAYAFLRYGMSLDWLNRFDEALPYVNRAVELDPNNNYVVAIQGWHFLQAGADAHHWGDKQIALKYYWQALALLDRAMNLGSNKLAPAYLEIVRRKMSELSEGK